MSLGPVILNLIRYVLSKSFQIKKQKINTTKT